MRAAVPIVALLAGCTGFQPRVTGQCPDIEALPGDPATLAIGDSIFAWRSKRCHTIPDRVAENLGRPVINLAVNGARISGGTHPIEEQYVAGDWAWVILDGGGNDLNARCACGSGCDPVLDDLVTADGLDGSVPALVDRILDDGARVLLYGYYEVDERAWYGLGECGEEVDVLRDRYAVIASTRPDVVFVDGRDAVTVEGTPGAYAFDNVHPTRQGARLIGELIADAIAAAEAAP